jgi:hypothetical protein
MQNKTAAVLFTIIISTAFYNASAQKMVNSPYARFNLGTLEPAGSFRSLGMGGTGTAIRDNSSVYYTNPASYSSIDTISFLFDFGIDYGINLMSDGTTSHSSYDMNFDHLIIGFPLLKGWGFGAGIIPFSNGYYSISESVLEGDPEYDPITGAYNESHRGEGGISSFFAGSGLNLSKNLSAGVNMTLLFGSVRRINQFDFIDYLNVYHNNNTERLQLNGLNFEYGLQYSASLKKNYFINVGASMSSGKNYRSKYEKYSFRYNYYGASDTVFSSTDSSRIFVPATIRMGLAFGIKNKLTAALDYEFTNWSEATLKDSEGYLGNTRAIHFGVEYIPEKFSNYNFLRRVEYRIGTHIGDNYLVINGEQIKEFGISFGIGLPLRRTFSKANLFIDYTKRSGGGELLHTENYFTVGASLNLYDRWFMKRQYD